MITRIVKLTIDPSRKEEFIAVFKNNKHHIEACEGCTGVKLLQDQKFDNIFFTYSHWQQENNLNNYRKSEIFGVVWKATKATFCDVPEAWTTISIA